MAYSNKKNSGNKKKIVLFLAVFLLLAGLGTWGILKRRTHTNNQPSVQTNSSEPTEEEKKQQTSADLRNKQQAIESTPTTQTPSTTSTSIDLSTQKESNGTVTVFTKLYGISGGACSLTVKNGQKSVSYDAEVVYQSAYSSCAGFSVPIASLWAGNWELTLKLTPSTGQAQTKTITAEIK